MGNYPAVSHTFIANEVSSLRAGGKVGVRTISLRATPTEQLLTEADRAEAARTLSILPATGWALIGAHLEAAVRWPRRYVGAARLAWKSRRSGLRGALLSGAYFAEAGLVSQQLRRDGITHIHAHFANSASWVAMLAAHLRGGTWSFTMHGPTEFDDVQEFALSAKVADASFVACIGDYCRSQLMRFSAPSEWSKLVTVRCGVDPERFVPPDARPATTAAANLLSVGRLMPDKGQWLLIDAVAELRDGGWEGQLSLVGDGPDRAALEQRVRELGLDHSVRFLGNVGQDQLPSLYRAADIFVLASFAEGVPVVLMEAMASGLPVVASRIMGVGELVDDGRTGTLVAPARADLLADAIQRLTDDPEVRVRLGRAGRQTVLDGFAHPAVVTPLAVLLRGCADQAGRRAGRD